MSARPERRRRKEARPGEILDAAFEEFALNGFDGTRLDDVAARAGVTKGTIYVYFTSKEDLFIATVVEMSRPAKEQILTAATAPNGPAIDIMRQHMRFLWTELVENRRGRILVRMIIAEGSRFPDLADRWFADVMAPSLQALQSILRYGVERGEFHASRIVDFPQLIMAPVINTCNWLNLFGDRWQVDLDVNFETAMDLLTRGLAVQPLLPAREGQGGAKRRARPLR